MRRLVGLVAGLVVAVTTATASGDDGFVVTSSDDHLWIVMPGRETDSRHLMHHARRVGGPYVASQRKLNTPPEHLAAWGERVWIVMPPAGGRRDVFTLELQHNPALDAYLTLPRDRLEVATPLPDRGEVLALVGTELGPVALLAAGGAGAAIELLRLGGDAWEPLPLPEDLGPGCHLVPPGGDPESLVLLAPDGRGGSVVHERREDGTWSRATLPIDGETIVSTGRVDAHPFVVRQDDDGVHVDYLRTRPLPLASFAVPGDSPHDRWAVLGLADGPRVVIRTGEGLLIRRIDPTNGTLTEPEALIRPPLPANQVWHLSLLLAVAVTLGLIAIVFRPGSRAPIELPPGHAALSPFTRLFSLAVDLLPGGIVAVAFYGAVPAELIRAPLFAPDLSDSAAYVVMAAVTFGHSVILETITGRSLGKLVMGGRVVGTDGQSVPRLRLVLRNLVKLLVLVLPPLAILCLLNPYLQGVHDLMARTVVVGPVEPDEGSGEGDRADR